MDQKVAVLRRPGYTLHNGEWLPRGREVTYQISYGGTNQRDALVRMLSHNNATHLAEVIKYIAWVNTGYYSIDAMLTVSSLGRRKEFYYGITRRMDSGLVVAGNMSVHESRQMVVDGLANIIDAWLRGICLG